MPVRAPDEPDQDCSRRQSPLLREVVDHPAQPLPVVGQADLQRGGVVGPRGVRPDLEEPLVLLVELREILHLHLILRSEPDRDREPETPSHGRVPVEHSKRCECVAESGDHVGQSGRIAPLRGQVPDAQLPVHRLVDIDHRLDSHV